MDKDNIIGSYAIIGFEVHNETYNDQTIYIIVDFSNQLDSFKIRALKDNAFEDAIYQYRYKEGFWLRTKFVKILGNPKINKLVHILYGD